MVHDTYIVNRAIDEATRYDITRSTPASVASGCRTVVVITRRHLGGVKSRTLVYCIDIAYEVQDSCGWNLSLKQLELDHCRVLNASHVMRPSEVEVGSERTQQGALTNIQAP